MRSASLRSRWSANSAGSKSVKGRWVQSVQTTVDLLDEGEDIVRSVSDVPELVESLYDDGMKDARAGDLERTRKSKLSCRAHQVTGCVELVGWMC